MDSVEIICAPPKEYFHLWRSCYYWCYCCCWVRCIHSSPRHRFCPRTMIPCEKLACSASKTAAKLGRERKVVISIWALFDLTNLKILAAASRSQPQAKLVCCFCRSSRYSDAAGWGWLPSAVQLASLSDLLIRLLFKRFFFVIRLLKRRQVES